MRSFSVLDIHTMEAQISIQQLEKCVVIQGGGKILTRYTKMGMLGSPHEGCVSNSSNNIGNTICDSSLLGQNHLLTNFVKVN